MSLSLFYKGKHNTTVLFISPFNRWRILIIGRHVSSFLLADDDGRIFESMRHDGVCISLSVGSFLYIYYVREDKEEKKKYIKRQSGVTTWW